MRKQYTQIMAICAFALFLGACRARFYTPNRNPIPLFRDKGDVFIDASTNLTNKYDLTLGYALTHDIAAYVGYAGAGINGSFPDEDSINDKYRYSGNMVNLGVGYFLNQDISDNFRFEIFADYATGNYRNKVTGNQNNFFNGNFSRIGIMPNVAFTNKNFSVAYSIRASQISFSNASVSDSAFWRNDIRRLNSRDNYTMIEQAIQFRFGFEHVKFQLQLAAYNTVNSNDQDHALPDFNASIMIGVAINTNILGKGSE